MRINSVAAVFFVLGVGTAVQFAAACSSSSSGGGTSSGSGSGSSSGGEDATGSSSGTASSSSGSSSGGSSSSGSSSGGTSGSCTPSDGTYAVTFTADSGNAASCPAASTMNYSFTYPPEGGTDGGLSAGCSCQGGDMLQCIEAYAASGLTYDSVTTFTSTGLTCTLKITSSDGGDCQYTCTGTKM